MPRRPPLTLIERVSYRAARAMAALPPRVQVRLAGGRPVEIDGQRLDPEIQLTLAALERQGNPPIESLTPKQARHVVRRQAVMAGGVPVGVGAVRDLTVDGATGPLRARYYSPDEPGGPHPLLLFVHGGGFVVGDLDSHDAVCRLLCRHAGTNVLSIDYRLAPEHPFPAGLEDSWAALRWAAAHAEELGADPRRLAVGGDSAGGNISAVLAQMAKREGGPDLALQLLIYPKVDEVEKRPSLSHFGDGFYLTAPLIEWFGSNYTSGPDAPADADPRVSPLRADDLSGLAPAYVITAAFDPLRDEGEAYAHALREAGVRVAHRRFGGLIHGFINTVGISRVSRDAVIEMGGTARAFLGRA